MMKQQLLRRALLLPLRLRSRCLIYVSRSNRDGSEDINLFTRSPAQDQHFRCVQLMNVLDLIDHAD